MTHAEGPPPSVPAYAKVEEGAASGRLITGTSYLVVGHVLGKLSGLLVFVLLARYLQPSEFGQFSFAYAAALLPEALSDLGIGPTIARDGGRGRVALRTAVIGALPLKLPLAALGTVMALAVAFATGARDDLLETVLFLSLAQAMLALTALGRAVFQSAERMEFDAISIALEGLVRFLLVAYAVFSGFGLLGVAKAYAVAAGIVLVATTVFAIRRFLWPVTWPTGPWRPMAFALLQSALPFALFWLLASIPLRADIVLLRPLAGDAAAGQFAAAVRLLEPTLIVPTVLATALLPLAARHHRTGLDTLPALLSSTQKALFLIGGLIVALTWVLAPEAVPAVLGPGFTAAVGIVQILSLGMLAVFAKLGLARLLFAVGCGRDLVLTQSVGVMVNFALLLWLTPAVGPISAAVAFLVAEALTVGLMFFALRGFVIAPTWASVARPLGVVLVALSPALLPGDVPPVALAAATGLAYVTGLAWARPFTAEEVSYLRGSFVGLPFHPKGPSRGGRRTVG